MQVTVECCLLYKQDPRGFWVGSNGRMGIKCLTLRKRSMVLETYEKEVHMWEIVTVTQSKCQNVRINKRLRLRLVIQLRRRLTMLNNN